MYSAKCEVRQSGPILPKGPVRGEGSRLRVAHLTDIHVGARSADISADGFAAALESLGSLDPLPDCLILGGDMVHDGMVPDLADSQWQLFAKVLQAGRPKKGKDPIPIYPILGNHDVSGWGLKDLMEASVVKEKALSYLVPFSAPNCLTSNQTYYSVDRNGWRLIFLDSINGRGPDCGHGSTYYGGLDKGLPLDKQDFYWLEKQLKTKQHLAVFSHIPVFSSTALLWNDYPYISNPDIDLFKCNFPRPNSFWAVQDSTIMHFMKEMVREFAQKAYVCVPPVTRTCWTYSPTAVCSGPVVLRFADSTGSSRARTAHHTVSQSSTSGPMAGWIPTTTATVGCTSHDTWALGQNAAATGHLPVMTTIVRQNPEEI